MATTYTLLMSFYGKKYYFFSYNVAVKETLYVLRCPLRGFALMILFVPA